MQRSAFMEDPVIRQQMYEKYGYADRNEGGVPSGNSMFDRGNFGRAFRGLDIDSANFELWKQRMTEQDGRTFLGATEPIPKSVATQRAFQNAIRR